MLSSYYQEVSGKLSFSREQGSDFAKRVAGDFNPLHDVEAKRFCIPGDLLFSVVLEKYGISEKMQFEFLNMVTENVALALPEPSDGIVISDGNKDYLSVTRSGKTTLNSALIEHFIKICVAFSGQAFPHVVIPVMAEQNVMINPDRPLAIYRSMSIELDRLDLTSPAIDPYDAIFEYEGKKGSITLPFGFVENGEIVGRGEKRMLISGIKVYNGNEVDEMLEQYSRRKLRKAS